jgi:hypothetical protein
VLGLGVVQCDALSVEVVVEVLDLLVAREEHEPARSTGGLQVAVDVEFASLGGHVDRHTDLLTCDAGHLGPLLSL